MFCKCRCCKTRDNIPTCLSHCSCQKLLLPAKLPWLTVSQDVAMPLVAQLPHPVPMLMCICSRLSSSIVLMQAFSRSVLEPPLPIELAIDKLCLLCLHLPALIHLYLSLIHMHQQQIHQHQQQQQTFCQACKCRVSCTTRLVHSKHIWACTGRTASAMNLPPST